MHKHHCISLASMAYVIGDKNLDVFVEALDHTDPNLSDGFFRVDGHIHLDEPASLFIASHLGRDAMISIINFWDKAKKTKGFGKIFHGEKG